MKGDTDITTKIPKTATTADTIEPEDTESLTESEETSANVFMITGSTTSTNPEDQDVTYRNIDINIEATTDTTESVFWSDEQYWDYYETHQAEYHIHHQ